MMAVLSCPGGGVLTRSAPLADAVIPLPQRPLERVHRVRNFTAVARQRSADEDPQLASLQLGLVRYPAALHDRLALGFVMPARGKDPQNHVIWTYLAARHLEPVDSLRGVVVERPSMVRPDLPDIEPLILQGGLDVSYSHLIWNDFIEEEMVIRREISLGERIIEC